MAYIGNDLEVAFQSYLIIDDISGDFDGSETSFTLNVNGAVPVPFPINPQQCLISVAGVIQEPDPTGSSGFNLSGNNIVFSSAPAGSSSFFGVVLAGADYVNVGVDFPAGSVAAPSITFVTDKDTGFFSKAANEIGIACAGTEVGVFSSTGLSSGFADGSAASPSIFFTSDTNTGIARAAADELIISAGGVERASFGSSEVVFNDPSNDVDFRVESNGNTHMLFVDAGNDRVGIGTSSPDELLHVANTGGGASILIETNASSGGNLLFGDNSSNTVGRVQYVHSDNSMRLHTSGSERLRIDSSGRLLVGLTSGTNTDFGFAPSVQVAGNGASAAMSVQRYVNGTGEPHFAFQKSRNGTIGGQTLVQDDDKVGTISFEASDGSSFQATARIHAEIDGTPGTADMPGRLIFSTTADNAGTPTERMRIDRGGTHRFFSSSATVRCLSGASAGTSVDIFIGSHSATSTTSEGTISFKIKSNGNVQNTNNSYGAISDAKLKENIVDASSQWDDIKDLRVRNYNFIEGETHTQLGVVAQEVETVSPGLVTESPDTDDDGNDLGTVTKSVNYSVLYMKAVKALQEAMDRIETLEAKVAALEAQ